MAAKPIKTDAPGVYKRGERYTLWVRSIDGKRRWKTVDTFDEAVEYRRRWMERIRELTTPGEYRYEAFPWFESMEVRPHHPQAGEEEPAWRCGHPKVPENTHGPYPSHQGQCAICWRWARRRADIKWRDTMTPHRGTAYRHTQWMGRLRNVREATQAKLAELEAEKVELAEQLEAEGYTRKEVGSLTCWYEPESGRMVEVVLSAC